MIKTLIIICDIVFWIASAIKEIANSCGELLRLFQKDDDGKKSKS